MYRAAKPISRSFLAFGAASATVAAVSLRTPVYADELTPPRKEKLSIYPKPDPEILLVKTDSVLASHIGIAREYTTSAYSDAKGTVHSAVDKWIGVEHAVERQVKEIIPQDEPMTPGLLYVGVAALTGSVIGRRRNVLVRAFLPVAFGATALAYFLPKTSQNLTAYFSSLERTYAPELASKHSELNDSLSKSLVGASKTYTDAKTSATDGLRSARKQLEQTTGLKVGDLDASATVAAAKTQVEGTLARIQEETRQLGNQVQDGVDGLKKQAEEVLTETSQKAEREEPPKRLV